MRHSLNWQSVACESAELFNERRITKFWLLCQFKKIISENERINPLICCQFMFGSAVGCFHVGLKDFMAP